MPHKVTPSRRKFRIAKKFVEELQKDYGSELVAVFAVGDIAANVAHEASDIDVIIVFKKEPESIFARDKIVLKNIKNSFFEKFGQRIDYFCLGRESFENSKKLKSIWPAFEILHNGALPLFGKKDYLKKFEGKSFKFPSLKSIRQVYTAPKFPYNLYERSKGNPDRLLSKNQRKEGVDFCLAKFVLGF